MKKTQTHNRDERPARPCCDIAGLCGLAVTLLVFLAPHGAALATEGEPLDDCTQWVTGGAEACRAGICAGTATKLQTRTCVIPLPTERCTPFDATCCTYGPWSATWCSQNYTYRQRTSTLAGCAPQTENLGSGCCNYTPGTPYCSNDYTYTPLTSTVGGGACPPTTSSVWTGCCNYTKTVLGDCGAKGCSIGWRKVKKTTTVPGCSDIPPYCEDAACPNCSWTQGEEFLGCGLGSCGPGQKTFNFNPNISACGVKQQCVDVAACLPPPAMWVPYGFSEPLDPISKFGLPSNTKKSFLGLAAKGNIVLGDYTDRPGPNDFPGKVVPKLDPSQPGAVTRAYVVDPSDAALGYDNALSDAPPPNGCGGRSPCFDGNYNQVDEHGNGRKTDGTPRKFYESSLPDAVFQNLVDPNLRNPDYATPITIDAVLYTNHALTGLVRARHLVINGARVSRDDALVWNRSLTINHDPRLVGDRILQAYIALPFTIKRPQLTSWRECPYTGCQ